MYEITKSDLSMVVYKFMRSKNLSRKDFGKRVGLSKRKVRKLLAGDLNMRLSTFVKIITEIDGNINITPEEE
jgi:predicted transcriptional regulator